MQLQPNATKTEISYFHLKHKLAEKKLNIQFENTTLMHNKTEEYLRVNLTELTTQRACDNNSLDIENQNYHLSKHYGTT